jgi:hypothetical protein
MMQVLMKAKPISNNLFSGMQSAQGIICVIITVLS